MSDDWQRGDLALCVRKPDYDLEASRGSWNPRPGGVYTVSEVSLWAYGDDLILDFAEDPAPLDDSGWDANAFRKIKPLTPEEHEQAMTELLTGKPVKEVA